MTEAANNSEGIQRISSAWLAQSIAQARTMTILSHLSTRLMSFGAPFEVIEWAQHASIHALEQSRKSLELVVAYGGDVPDMPLGGVSDAMVLWPDLESITVAIITYGCVGHTRAALEASQAYEDVTKAPVAEQLHTMAQANAEDAERAWKALRWAIKVGDSQVEHAARNAFQSAVFELSVIPELDPNQDELRAHGCLTQRCRFEVHLDAHESVIMPAYRALFDNQDPT